MKKLNTAKKINLQETAFIHSVTLSLGHSVTRSLGHLVTWSLGHLVTWSLGHSVTRSLGQFWSLPSLICMLVISVTSITPIVLVGVNEVTGVTSRRRSDRSDQVIEWLSYRVTGSDMDWPGYRLSFSREMYIEEVPKKISENQVL